MGLAADGWRPGSGGGCRGKLSNSADASQFREILCIRVVTPAQTASWNDDQGLRRAGVATHSGVVAFFLGHLSQDRGGMSWPTTKHVILLTSIGP
jgi:hypothetical protein